MMVTSVRPRHRTCIAALVGVLLLLVGGMGRLAEGTSHWPASISGPTGFQDLGKAITKDPGFPAKGSEIDKARFVFSRLPEIAKKYSFEAGSGGLISQGVIGAYRYVPWLNDPEDTDSLKGCTGWGNCAEWSNAFSEMLNGAGVSNKVAYGDKKGGTGRSLGHGGTDTMVIVEERTADGAISRRVFDPFRAAFHGPGYRPDSGTLAEWGDRPLTDNDKLPRDAGNDSWQSDPRINKPFIKDHNQNLLPPHEPISVQEQRLRGNREADERKKAEAEAKRQAEEQKRKKEEEAKRKAALDAALQQAQALLAAARTAVGRVQATIGVVQGAATAGANASSAAGTAEGAVQQAKGAADAARSACARVVSEGVIDAARVRAEAAASEVGTLYQEVVNIANETCQAAAQVQGASNANAYRILTKKTEGLAARAQSRAASAQAALRRAQAEAGQAARQHANRLAARESSATAKAALTAARGQVSAAEGTMNSYEATITGAQGQVGTAQSEIGQVEQYKRSALGVLAPFLSEPAAQALVAVINGVVAPSVDGLDQQLQTAMTTVQQARTKVTVALGQLTAWEGSVAGCEGLAPTDGLAQAATAAASAAELFLPKVKAAAERAAQCAGAVSTGVYNPATGDPGMGGSKPNLQGTNAAGQGFQQGAPGAVKPPTAGALGGEQMEQPGLQPPPATDTASGGLEPQPAPGGGRWCYSAQTQQRYQVPMGHPCPPSSWTPPHVTPSDEPAVRVPHDKLQPDPGMGDKPGGKVGKPMGPKPNPGTTAQPTGKPDRPMGPKPSPGPTDHAAGKPDKPMGPGPACGPMTSCTCKGGGKGHIPCDKAKGACHCGAG